MYEIEWFQRIKEYIRRAMGILAALAVCAGMIYVLNYLYVDTKYGLARSTWHSYYEDKGKIKNLFLGSSHVFCDIDARILSELTGEYSFDLASTRQPLNGSFYLLREADRDNELTHVYLEMYYGCSAKFELYECQDMIDVKYSSNWENIDNMRMSENKLAYMLSSVGPNNDYIDMMLPFCRYRSQLGDWGYIKQVMDNKRKKEYITYQYHDKNMYYLGQGFYGSDGGMDADTRCWEQWEIPAEDPIGEKTEKYLRRIIQYCQERGISITLFVSPMDNLELVSAINYDIYVDEIRRISNEYQIPFYDFNLTKNEYFPIQYDRYFKDAGHLNLAGAEKFTRFFHQIIVEEEAENERYFYDSYAEKLQDLEPEVYGLYYIKAENDQAGEQSRTMWLASNRDFEMEYKIVLTSNEGESYIVQDFDTNKEFMIYQDESGVCTITARMKDSSEELQTIEINY